MPPFFTRLETILEKEGSGMFVGNSLTHADLYIAHFFSRTKEDYCNNLENYPLLCHHQDLVFKQADIANWIVNRPQTLM
jgi:glutathione S-transferase